MEKIFLFFQKNLLMNFYFDVRFLRRGFFFIMIPSFIAFAYDSMPLRLSFPFVRFLFLRLSQDDDGFFFQNFYGGKKSRKDRDEQADKEKRERVQGRKV